MTKNQIEYLKLLETRRSNEVNEGINRDRLTYDREIGLGQLAETKRHNLAGEQQQVAVLGETQRHNVVSEQLQSTSISESMRSNRAQEALQNRNLLENERSNKAREAETERSNKAREAETTRANKANELEYNRSNLAREAETHRTNVANERIRSRGVDAQFASVAAQYASIAETSKYHAATVALEGQRLAEVERSNKATEAEQHRTNVARESETTRTNKMRENNEMLTRKANISQKNWELHLRGQELDVNRRRADTDAARAEEQARHNAASEGINIFNTVVGGVSNTAKAVIPYAMGG